MDCYFHFTEEITDAQRGQVNSGSVVELTLGSLDSSASEFFHPTVVPSLNNSHSPALEGKEDAF